MKFDVYNLKNDKVGEVEVSDDVFGTEVKPHLHHEMVRYQMAKKRRGTHAVLNRAAVAGTTKKAYRQKGTGRARHGSHKAPVYVGGGVVFGPSPRSYAFNVPKKVRRAALRSVLSEKAAGGKLKVVDAFSLDAPKTKRAAAGIDALGAGSALVVDVENANLKLSVRNLPNAKFLQAVGLNVYDVLRYDHLIVTQAAIEAIDGALK